MSSQTPDIDEHYESQVRTWRVQRVGWCVLAALVVATVLGGLGPGVFSKVSELDSAGLRVQYDRFVRYEAPAVMQIELPPTAADERDFLIAASWLRGVHLQTVQPEPLRVQSEGAQVRYTIGARRGAPAQISLHFEPDAPGSLHGSVGLEGSTPAPISQFVYP